jgi:hypothetical protein
MLITFFFLIISVILIAERATKRVESAARDLSILSLLTQSKADGAESAAESDVEQA